MTDTPTAALPRAVRGVRVHSRQTIGACAPTYGRVELDFEPVPAGVSSSVEFTCTAEPEPSPEYERALIQGVLRELAAAGSGAPDPHPGAPVRARVLVRAMSWHWVDSCETTFTRLGALAVREALSCVAEDREPRLVDTRARLTS
ncbi:hypothetical protein [Streptomyces sp. NPDC058773]|uniref:hypothetical protein n=1 Tax=Streptomyces sp. NPDC058773 TaxID=3346632 RepID=UPI00369304F5